MSTVSVTGETKLAAGGTRESRSETLYVWRSILCVCVFVFMQQRDIHTTSWSRAAALRTHISRCQQVARLEFLGSY